MYTKLIMYRCLMSQLKSVHFQNVVKFAVANLWMPVAACLQGRSHLHPKLAFVPSNILTTTGNCVGETNLALHHQMDRGKRIWYLSPMRAAKVQASLRIRAVSPEPPLLAQTSRESRGIFKQKARSLAPLNDWACAVKICHDGMLEDTNSLDGAQIWSEWLVDARFCVQIPYWLCMDNLSQFITKTNKMPCAPS